MYEGESCATAPEEFGEIRWAIPQLSQSQHWKVGLKYVCLLLYMLDNDDLFLLEHISVGALGDSFYEYLLKSWLMTNKKDVEARDMFYSSLTAIDHQLVRRVSNKAVYLTDLKNGRPDNKMQHLVCKY